MAFQASSIQLWREENRAPVFPGRMQRWILETTQGESSDVIAGNLEAAVKRNAGRDVIRAFRVVQLAVDPSRIDDETEVLAGIGGIPVGPKPQSPPGAVAALVEFAWDSPREDVAWLSESMALGLVPRNTFRDPDTLLVAVLEPGGLAPAPEPGLLEQAEDLLQSQGSSIAGLAAVALGGVALYAIAKGED